MEQVKEYEYVDLGLPSGLKWAKCNVGAEKETDYGFYFQWGDVKNKSNADCIWESYKYYDDSNNTLTKYNTSSEYGETPDNITTLKAEDDAARAYMGGDWRMPTRDEFRELYTYTDDEWTQVNGVNGWKFTSRVDKNKYIFIPAAGYCGYGSVHGVGRYGCVWSSSLDGGYPYVAWGMGFNLFNFYMSNYIRYGGRSVRGVID